MSFVSNVSKSLAATILFGACVASANKCIAQQNTNAESELTESATTAQSIPATSQVERPSTDRTNGGERARSRRGTRQRGSGGERSNRGGGSRGSGATTLDQNYISTKLPAGVRYVSDVAFKEVDGIELKLDLLLPKENHETETPLAVWIHGGAWMRGNKARDLQRFDQLAARILERGVAFVSISYRLSGQASFPAPIVDCNDALAYLYEHCDQYNLDMDRMFVMGTSAGGHLASLLGASHNANVAEFASEPSQPRGKILGIVDFYGPIDLVKLQEKRADDDVENDQSPEAKMLGVSPRKRPDLAAKASPLTYVSADSPPFLIFHGDRDVRVPMAQSQLLSDALTENGVSSKLVVVDGARHGDQKFDDAVYNDHVMTFLNRLLDEAEPK
ncbi:MAG: alpha/beta hydrolase fold domain-containing protein [Rhodopirellula sp. JB044]|uniref:alpha/beta hydrolase fold domain-containing protein n=1 Tax=Rhodopirellula sp. JB044 TaxID=3342844 RepID=UPI00370CE7AA